MAEEIGALRAVLALESAAFDKGVASARRQLGAMDGSLQRTGGQVVQFGQRVSRDGARAFNDLNRSAGSTRAGLQNVGFQVQDLAVQIAGGTSATRALAQQLPQLLSGFGLFGVLAGTASAVLIPLVGYLFQAGKATKSWTDELSLTGGSIGSVQGAVSALEGVQRQYNDAIAASGGASSAAASLVISNSAKEFEARKQLLGVEIQLLKIRGQEQASARQNTLDSIKAEADTQIAGIKAVRDLQAKSQILDEVGAFDPTVPQQRGQVPEGVGPGIQGFGDVATAYGRALQGRERDVLAVQKLNAELALTNITISETETLMNSTFESVAGGATAAAGSGGGRGGGGAPAAAKAVEGVKTEVEKLSQGSMQLQSSFGAAFVDMVTGAKSAQEAVAGLLQDLARMLANQAFQSLLGAGGSGIFASVGKVFGFSDGGAISNGRVTAFAAGGVVNSPTVFPMANGAGLMGEAGPEAIMPLTRVGGKLGVRSAGGGAPVINIDARGAVEGTDVRIAKALRDALPGFTQTAVLATKQAAARGRL